MSHEPNRIAQPGRLRALGAVAIAVAFTGVAAPTGAAPAAAAASCANGYVGLTFDDGPSASTDQLLAALTSHHLRATMFDQGNNSEAMGAYLDFGAIGGVKISAAANGAEIGRAHV